MLLPFSNQELESNRNGQMTTGQHDELKALLLEARQQAGEDVSGFSVVMLAVIAMSFIAGLPSSMTMSLLVLALSMFVIYEFFNTTRLRRLENDVESRSVFTIEGHIQIQQRSEQKFWLRVQNSRYSVQIEERLFRVLENNASYRLYVTAGSGILLSMERSHATRTVAF